MPRQGRPRCRHCKRVIWKIRSGRWEHADTHFYYCYRNGELIRSEFAEPEGED